jgi:amino acid adenylation domain-containing protein
MNTKKDLETIVASQKNKERDYWLKKLSGDLVKSVFPKDYIERRPGEGEDPIEIVKFDIPGESASKLIGLSNHSDPRLFILLLAGLIVLVKKYTNTDDILVGVPVIRQEIEGKLVNTLLVLRNDVGDRITFKELILKVRQTMVEATENQNYPVNALLFELNLSRAEQGFQLFDIAILLENIHSRTYLEQVQSNVLFSWVRSGESLRGTVEYNTSMYKEETITRIVRHLTRLLDIMLFNIDSLLSGIDILSEQEKKQLLFDFNNTKKEYPGEKTLHEIFEEQVETAPNKIAVVFEDRQLTYRELSRKTTRLAGILRQKGVKKAAPVGLVKERSIESIVGIFAVLKAGGAYLPISLEYPEDRIKYILGDSNTRLVLTGRNDFNLSNGTYDRVDFDDIDWGLGKREQLENINSPTDLAYVIYTSGSTGNPKGVMIEHRNVHNLVVGLNERIYRRYSNSLKLSMVAPFEFDASVQQVFGALLQGHGLYIVPGEVRLNGVELLEYYKKYRIEISDGTPTHIRLLVESLGRRKVKLNVKHFLIAGEIFPKELAKRFLNCFKINFPGITNIYGPTETCVDSTSYEISPDRIRQFATVPIGSPLPNEQVYILGKDNQLKPIGVIGELCIGGDGVARGYIGKGDLDKGKFVDNPFINGNGNRMYKTGDLARWLPGGDIEFIGRGDNQVKIRGYRIELGEIETLLLEHDKIKEAVVTANYRNTRPGAAPDNNPSDRVLCAYFTSDDPLTVSELRKWLSHQLPDYMVPTYFMPLEKIPLTHNGKLDREALPEPELRVDGEYTPPLDEIEEKLVSIWSGILGIDEAVIGTGLNFFDIGGDSLKVVILVANIHKELDIKLSLAQVFGGPTIRELAGLLKGASKNKFVSIKPVEKKEYYPVSSAQKRIYLEQQKNPETTIYNMTQRVELEWMPEKSRFEKTIRELIKRHESFKTSFELIGDEVVQKIHEEVDFDNRFVEVEGSREHAVVEDFVCSFDLRQAPLLRVAVINVEKTRYILIVDMHHIISDGVSLEILVRDFMVLYAGKELEALRLQYKDYSQWQNNEGVIASIKRQAEYWLKEFEGDPPVLDLPTDYKRPEIQDFEGSVIKFKIGDEETTALKKLAGDEGTTLYMVLLTIFNILVAKICRQQEIIVCLVTAGRRHVDLEKIIGIFINTLAAIYYPVEEISFRTFLEEVKQKTLEIFENQDYPFEDLVKKVLVDRNPGRNPLSDLAFGFWKEVETIKEEKDAAGEMPQLMYKAYEHKTGNSILDLFLFCVEKGDTLNFSFDYRTKLFKTGTIQRFIVYFRNIISAVLTNPGTIIKEIDVIPESEEKEILSKIKIKEGDLQVEFDL